jgi:hypothetical protein
VWRRGRWRKVRPGRPAARAAGLRAGGGPAAPPQTPQFAKSHETGSTPSVVLCLSKTGPITASGGSSAFICTDVTPPQQGVGPDCARASLRACKLEVRDAECDDASLGVVRQERDARLLGQRQPQLALVEPRSKGERDRCRLVDAMPNRWLVALRSCTRNPRSH